jgi:CBS domain containing-hemolysin-like protein
VLDEGQQVGVLHPTQRQLSQNFFLVAGKAVRQVCTPMSRIPVINQNLDVASAIKHAQRYSMADIPVSGSSRTDLKGYIHLIDLLVLDTSRKKLPEPKPFMAIRGDEPFAEALLRMQTNRETLAKVVGNDGELIGLLSVDQLTSQLLRGPLESLRR